MLQKSSDECTSSRTTPESRNGISSTTSPDVDHVKQHKRHATVPKTQADILKMLETETFHKETLSPFNPLPAIGQKVENVWEDRFKERSIKSLNEVLFTNFDSRRKKSAAQNFYAIINDEEENSDFSGDHNKTIPTLNEVNLRNYRLSVIQNNTNEEKPTDLLKEIKENKAKKLLRQQTYDVIDPVFTQDKDAIVLPQKLDSDSELSTGSHSRGNRERRLDKNNNDEPLEKSCTTMMLGPKTFEAKKRLLDRREREIIPIALDEAISLEKDKLNVKTNRQSKSDSSNEVNNHGKMNELIEIFDSLQISRKYKEKVKKPNYWF